MNAEEALDVLKDRDVVGHRVAGPIEHSVRTSNNQSDVHRQLGIYDHHIELLRDVLNVLDEKLSFVLMADDTNEKPTTPSEPNRSTLAGMIGDLNDRLRYATDRLTSITERIDL